MKQILTSLLVMALFSSLKMEPRHCSCVNRSYYYKGGKLVYRSSTAWYTQWLTGPSIKSSSWTVEGKEILADSIVFKSESQ